MRNAFLILLLHLLLPLHAQVSELGITGGAMFYVGDINPEKLFPRHTALSGGVLYRYNFDDRYALRLQGLMGRLEAYDSETDDPLLVQRNLGFRSRLFEVSALLEINFLKYRALRNGSVWSPYIFFGLAYFNFDPVADIDGRTFQLQPLGTEGQTLNGGKGYALGQMAIPFGAGIKFAVTKRIDLQIEHGVRRTYTDHLDDVSGKYVDNGLLMEEANLLTALLADRSELRTTGFNTDRARGNPSTRDWYHYSGLSITFRLTKWTECDAMWDGRKRGTQR